jgi:hypothetical protein
MERLPIFSIASAFIYLSDIDAGSKRLGPSIQGFSNSLFIPKVPPSTFDLLLQRVSDLYSIKRSKEISNRNKYLHFFNIRSTLYEAYYWRNAEKTIATTARNYKLF